MVKSQLINKLADLYPSFLRKDLEKAVNILFKEIVNSLVRGSRVELRKFGTFQTRIRQARKARNPRTGQEIMIEEKRFAFFKMSLEMKKRLNKNFKKKKYINIIKLSNL